jgi:hypothetical protein
VPTLNARTRVLGFLLSLLMAACGAAADAPPDASTDAPPDAAVPVPDGAVACAPGTWDSDGDPGTACIAWTTCAPGAFVERDGATDLDRRCAPCAAGTFSADANQASCAALTSCAPGSYVEHEGTAASDRTCAPCAAGTFSAQANATACAAWTTCAAGSHVGVPGTAGADVVCATCPGGTFSSTDDAAACTPWTDCAAGQYVTTAGSAVADRTCQACADGEYSTDVNASACQPAGVCPAGTRQTASGTPTSPVQCAACEAGTYCPGGDGAQITCADGTWDDDGSAASPCIAWTACSPGFHVVADGSTVADRTCAACADGSYSDTVNAAACLPVGVCAAGEVQISAGSRTSATVCEHCDAGSYCAGDTAPRLACAGGSWDHDASAATACAAWTDCAAGQYVAADGSAIADRTCAACADGSYSDTDNAAACLPVGVCAAGEVQISAGSRTAATVCERCDAGTYCAGDTAPRLACTGGSWDHDASAATVCAAWTDCAAGQYVTAAGSAVADRTCAACTDGDTTSTANAVTCEPGAWLLSYFGPAQDLANDSLHLAYSLDGQRWAGLAHHQPVYQVSGLGTNHIRDPFILRKNDGSFVYLATDWTLAENDSDYWNHPSPRLFVADSDDLVTFTNPRLITVTDLPGPGGQPMHAWAPEAYYDAERAAYAIVWSGNDPSWDNRIYVSYTLDFETVLDPTPDVLFDPGYSVIDATIERADGRSYLFFKDETDGNGVPGQRGKDIQIARAPSPAIEPGAFSMWSTDYITRGAAQTVRQATEGPFVVHQPEQDRWILYADYYLAGGVFGAWTTPSLDAAPGEWTPLPASSFRFPPGVRHAHPVRITLDELDALIAHHGVSHHLRSTYSEGGAPFYVAHSWFHGLITPLDDRSRGQIAEDFLWKVVPGLADPGDPALVSFEAVGYPGRYLRVDSASPGRYPSCDEPSNRAWALCWVAEADRHHLLWLDAFADTTAFRADATFRRVPALNGDAAMISLQWYADPSRYLRHMAYQLFATAITGAVEQNDASFALERE